jgi:signal transduction histidine kinase
MIKQGLFHRLKHKISLTVLVSVLITLVAVIPVLVTITISQVLSRPQLISQSADAMAQDAHTHVQLLDAYLHNRLRDVQTVSDLYTLQQYAMGNTKWKDIAQRALMVGVQNDVNYDTWSLLDLHGRALIWYPMPPRMHGDVLIQPTTLENIRKSATAQISGVYYDPEVGNASIIIYVPVMGSTSSVVGVVRAEVSLNYIWDVVNSQTDNRGSYAFILDENGVRIAYNDPDGSALARSSGLFQAIDTLSPQQRQIIVSRDLYGNSERPVTVLHDPGLVAIQKDAHAPSRFEMVPAGQQEKFEVIKVQMSVVSWTYFALRPLKQIIGIADDQLHSTLLIAAIVLILAIVIGVATGRQITQPILHSIEQQRRAYEQQQYLNQLKDQILLNVSHELRTPLTEVYGYLELLDMHRSQLDACTQQAFLKNAIGGCEELQRLVSSMLDTIHSESQPQILSLQDISVAQIVKEVLELFSPRTLQNYVLQINVPEGLMVRADQQCLRQVLRNLLSNAFKYAEAHTTVAVDASIIESEHTKETITHEVCICVKDSGPGITSADIPLLFEKFVRLKRDLSSSIRGSGLGLYISKQLVEAMGGRIWVESSGIVGEGSRFYFTLPYVSRTDGGK